MLVCISILFSCLSRVAGSGSRKNSRWFPAVYQWEDGWVISAEGCRWQNESSWTECREKERDGGSGWLASALCWLQNWWWLPELCGVFTMKCLFPTSASRGLTKSFSSILCAQSFHTLSFSLFFTVTLCYTQHAFCSHNVLPPISLTTCSPFTYFFLCLLTSMRHEIISGISRNFASLFCNTD